MKNLKKEINCKIEHGKLIISFYKDEITIKRIKKGTKTVVCDSITLTKKDFKKVIEGSIFTYKNIQVAKYSEFSIVRQNKTKQRIVIYNEEFEEIKRLEIIKIL